MCHYKVIVAYCYIYLLLPIVKSSLCIITYPLLHHYYIIIIITSLLHHYYKWRNCVIMSSLLHIITYYYIGCFHYNSIIANYYHFYLLLVVMIMCLRMSNLQSQCRLAVSLVCSSGAAQLLSHPNVSPATGDLLVWVLTAMSVGCGVKSISWLMIPTTRAYNRAFDRHVLAMRVPWPVPRQVQLNKPNKVTVHAIAFWTFSLCALFYMPSKKIIALGYPISKIVVTGPIQDSSLLF